MKRWMGFLICFFIVELAMVPLCSAEETPPVVVGRIFYLQGDLLRYVPAEDDWVATVRDAPFGVEDTLYSGSQAMAELILPNGTWIRIGNSTQIQFIALDTDLTEMDVASGIARVYNKSSDMVIKTTCPFGYVLAYPGAVFDYYVGDNSVEVVALRGEVSFVHSATEAKYDIAAGSPSILADQQQVSSGEGNVDPDWDRWNMVRENFWASKARRRGQSFEYLPPNLHDESYVLDENGTWERVYYDGAERWFWRPTTVSPGWLPFTVGRWTDWYGDQTWIPAEPFGYLTHHYGNWVFVRNYWYWAPPVARVRVGMPFLGVGFFWYPGRVAWIHSGPYVGWVPLAPFETYYCYRPWGGPHAVVVNNINITQININVRNYAYVNRAIIINQNNFYNVNNYRNVQVTNINRTTIINNYRAAPVVNNTVIKNYTTIRQRFNYANIKVNQKPHITVLNRIKQNDRVIQEVRREKASVVQEQVKKLPEGRISREARIQQPKIPNYIVPATKVNVPKSEIQVQHKEVRPRVKSTELEKPPAKPEGKIPAKPREAEKPTAKPERVVPSKPRELEKPTTKPEGVPPSKPRDFEKPTAKPERVVPSKPRELEKPATKPEGAAPSKPREFEKPAAKPERVAPSKPRELEKPATKPEGVAPAKPRELEKPAGKPERVVPSKPRELEEPAAKPERVVPSRPREFERPATKPEGVAPGKPREFEKPERVAPRELEKPASKPEGVAPAKPRELEKPGEHEPPRY